MSVNFSCKYSRYFLMMAVLYLVLGMAVGIFMSANQDFTLRPLHTHINLLGWVSMTLFGLSYALIPKLCDGLLATLHFWLYSVGVFFLLIALFLWLSGNAWVEIFLKLLSVITITSGVMYAYNVIRNVRG